MHKQIDLHKQLSNHSFFSGVDCSGCNPFLICHKKGDVLTNEDQGRCYLMIVLEGTPILFTRISSHSGSQIDMCYPGYIYGYSNLITQSPQTAMLFCQTACSFLCIPGDEFIKLLNSSPLLWTRYVELCVNMIHTLSLRVDLLGRSSALEKLALYLCFHSDTSPDVRLQTSKEDLAVTIGISRASLFRSINELKDRGIIETFPKCFHILDRGALLDIVGTELYR